MGYQTVLGGSFSVTTVVTKKFMNFINRFSETRRMMRNPQIIKEMDPYWAKRCFRGQLGDQAGYYTPPKIIKSNWLPTHVKAPNKKTTVKNLLGDVQDKSVVNCDCPPVNQPGFKCNWIMPDRTTLQWNGSEKFVDYIEWLEYVIEHFFKPSGYVLNGVVFWQGDDFNDSGAITVRDNCIEVKEGSI